VIDGVSMTHSLCRYMCTYWGCNFQIAVGRNQSCNTTSKVVKFYEELQSSAENRTFFLRHGVHFVHSYCKRLWLRSKNNAIV